MSATMISYATRIASEELDDRELPYRRPTLVTPAARGLGVGTEQLCVPVVLVRCSIEQLRGGQPVGRDSAQRRRPFQATIASRDRSR
ncbi:hypothetical protein [Nocardia fluminea]|uniref:hypothetical protein n=1 Tax=Nocardia fluminea TaxID=134984 RepID=UPI003D132845